MDDSVCPRVPVNATRIRVCFKDLSAAEESVFTFRLRLAERDSEMPFGKSLTSKSCERKCANFALVQDEGVSEPKGLELTCIVPTTIRRPLESEEACAGSSGSALRPQKHHGTTTRSCCKMPLQSLLYALHRRHLLEHEAKRSECRHEWEQERVIFA
jgi:hypothetical protein